MKKEEIIRIIKEQHEQDLQSLIDFLTRNLPEDREGVCPAGLCNGGVGCTHEK